MDKVTLKLTAKQRQAAVLAAEDNLPDVEIAEQLGIHRSSLARWKELPAFQAQVEEHSNTLAERALQHGIARREWRVSVLQEAHSRLWKIVKERAADTSLHEVPGGKTGMIVRSLKSVGWGDSARVVEEYSVDTGLLREIRALHERAAKELGQEVDRKEVNARMEVTIDFLDGILNEEPYIDAKS